MLHFTGFHAAPCSQVGLFPTGYRRAACRHWTTKVKLPGSSRIAVGREEKNAAMVLVGACCRFSSSDLRLTKPKRRKYRAFFPTKKNSMLQTSPATCAASACFLRSSLRLSQTDRPKAPLSDVSPWEQQNQKRYGTHHSAKSRSVLSHRVVAVMPRGPSSQNRWCVPCPR